MQRADQVVLIGKPVGPVALDVAAAFWQSTALVRAMYGVLSGTTLALLCLTTAGGFGMFDEM